MIAELAGGDPVDVAVAAIEPPTQLRALGVRKQRRSTFDPPDTDLWTKYAGITPRSARAIAFIEAECLVPSGRNAGKPYRLLPFQRQLLVDALDGDPETGAPDLVVIVSGPRGIGKTGISAPLLVWALFDQEGAQVIAASTGMRTARLAYDRAVLIIERNERLADQVLIATDANNPKVTIPTRASELFPLPAEERHIVGMSPTLVVVDEVGYVDRATYEAMQTSLGKIDGSLLLGIGTPGLGTVDASGENLMWSLRQLYGGPDRPPGLRYIEYSADPTDDPGDPRTWHKANPGLGTLVTEAAVALDFRTMSAARFGQMRLGLWTQHESAWMQLATWELLEVDAGLPPAGAAITLGFDGSTSGDSTALVAYEVATGRLCVLGLWERPKGGQAWQVNRREVEDVVEGAFARYQVLGMYADPWGWRSELQRWREGFGVGAVQEFNTAARVRMGPATDAFMTAALAGALKWDGSPALKAHVLAAVAVRTQAGDVLAKDARRPQKIDLAVAAILAHEAARTIEEPARPELL